MQTIQVSDWRYDDLQTLAEEKQAGSIADLIAEAIGAVRQAADADDGRPAFWYLSGQATDLGIPDLSEQHDHYLYSLDKT